MMNIASGQRVVLPSRLLPSCKSSRSNGDMLEKCRPVLLAARRLSNDSCFLQAPRFAPKCVPGSPACAEGSPASLLTGPIGLPLQPLCDEQGRLRAVPMAAVLRQVRSNVQTRGACLAQLSARTRGSIRRELRAQRAPAWLREASNFDKARLSDERAKVGAVAQELNYWAQRLARSPQASVSLADTAELSRSLGVLARNGLRSDTQIEESLRRLQIHTEGSLAAQFKLSVEDLLYQKFEPYGHPGARSEWRVDAGIGAAAGTRAGVGGASVGAAAGVTFGIGRVRALGNDDEGFIQESRAIAASVGGDATVSFGGAARALLSAKVSAQKTTYTEYEGIRHLVESSDSRVSRMRHREIGHLLRDAPFKLRSLDDLTRRQRQAAFQEASLARLIGHVELPGEGGEKTRYRISPGLRAPLQKPPARGVAMRIAVQGEAAAMVGLPAGLQAQAGLSGGVAASHVQHDVLQPFWVAIGGSRSSFRHLDGEGLDEPSRSDSLDMQRRQQAILTAALRLAPALSRLGGPPPVPHGPGKTRMFDGFALSLEFDRSYLHRILQRMEEQFDLYCMAARQVAGGNPEAAQLMRDFERLWCVRGSKRELAYLQNVCLAHNALALRLRQLAVEQRARGDGGAAARWDADWSRLDALWNKLQTPDLPHRQARLLPYICFRDVLFPSTSERHVSLSLNASGGWSLAGGAAGLGAAAGVSVTAQFRRVHHPNYLREGEYIDLKFDFGASAVAAAQYGTVLRALNGLSNRLALPPELLEHAFVLTGTTPLLAISAEGGVQLMFRVFRPAFRTDGDAAYRLQFVRLFGTRAWAVTSGKVTVPIGPASTSIEASARARHTRLLGEWLGDDTLTYVMLRYNRMWTRAPHDEEGEWSGFARRHRQDFEKLFARLGDVNSAARKEAEFVMEQAIQRARGSDRSRMLADRLRFRRAMRRFRSSGSRMDFHGAKISLDRMLAHQLAGWKEVKAAARKHWQLDDRIRIVA
jgi:hypothetical protein